MNIPQFIKKATAILNEDAGSEGMLYKVTSKKEIKETKNDNFEIKEVKKDGDLYEAHVEFAYPHDYGFAYQTIKEAIEDLEIQAMQLIY